jgi:hypothetical protein
MELQLFLAGVDMLADLQKDELALIAENAQLLNFPDGRAIIKRGERWTS